MFPPGQQPHLSPWQLLKSLENLSLINWPLRALTHASAQTRTLLVFWGTVPLCVLVFGGSVCLGGLAFPGEHQLPHEELPEQGAPGVRRVAAVGGGPVGLDHRTEPQSVHLQKTAHRECACVRACVSE